MPFHGNIARRFFFLQSLKQWQEIRARAFRQVNTFDKHAETKKAAGSEKLNQYSNYYEIQTLCGFLNTDFTTVLNSDDTFCTKILLSNLEKITFESKFQELLAKQQKK